MSLLGQWVGNAVANAQQMYGGQLQSQANAFSNNMQSPFIPPSFVENVPEDELVFIGICTRWPPYASLQLQYLPQSRRHNVDCCQRMLML